jgi:hypothetical protein
VRSLYCHFSILTHNMSVEFLLLFVFIHLEFNCKDGLLTRVLKLFSAKRIENVLTLMTDDGDITATCRRLRKSTKRLRKGKVIFCRLDVLYFDPSGRAG